MKVFSFRRIKYIFGIYIYFTTIGLTLVTCASQQVLTKSLHDHLFTDYDTNLIPICNEGENVTVRVDLALRQVMELDEPRQILSTNVWVRLVWNDCRLNWNQSSFGNLTNIIVLYQDVWFPDITLVDSAANEVMFPGREFFSARITHSGSISYNFPTVLTSVCRVNVRYFPFDSQRCPLSFASWSYHGLLLDVINKNPTGDTDTFVENSEWIVKEIPVVRNVVYYNCCLEPYPDVTYFIVLQRRPAFYIITMLFPCILVSFVSALTFILPTECGEKVSLEITVLLSLAVFLLVVSEALPPVSDKFPIIGYYFATSMGLVSVSLLQTILIVNVFEMGNNGRKVPRWLKTLCFQYIGRIVFVKPNDQGTGVYVNHRNEEMENMKKKLSADTHLGLRSESKNRMATGRVETYKTDDNRVIHDKGHNLKYISANGKYIKSFQRKLPDNLEDPTFKLLQNLDRKLYFITSTMKKKSQEEDINAEWRDVANILDRVFLVLYCLTTTITTLTFLLQFV